MKYEEYDIDELLNDIEKLLGDEPKKKAAPAAKRPQSAPKAAAPAKKTAPQQKKPTAKAAAKKKTKSSRHKKSVPEKRPSLWPRFRQDLGKYFRYSLVSARAQLKSEVANSYLNWIWWVLEPLCFMLIYAFVFGSVFGSREEYFSVYIFIGLSMWNFFEKTMKGSVKIVKNNKSIVSKVYFPKFILLFTKMMVNGFKMLISFGIVAVMMLAYRIPLTWNILFAVPIILALVLLTFGCSCYMLHWGVYVEDLSNVINIVLKIVFYMTGIFYHVEKRIPQWGAALSRYNPMAFLLSSMRQCLIYSQTPEWPLLILWFAVGIVLACLGVRKIYQEENSYVKAI